MALAFAPSDAKRIYAFVEGTDSALFVSDDGGASWDKRDKSNWMVWRPFYFANLIVDPKNPDILFKTDGALIMSEDAGKSFATVGGFQGAHGDVHGVWIDPTNPQTVFKSLSHYSLAPTSNQNMFESSEIGNQYNLKSFLQEAAKRSNENSNEKVHPKVQTQKRRPSYVIFDDRKDERPKQSQNSLSCFAEKRIAED